MNFFLKRYAELGHEIDPGNIQLKKSIRINTLKISEELLVSRLKTKKVKLKKIPFTDSGYWVESDFALSSTPEYLHGYYYIQEAASQMPVQVLSPEKGELVLDMCAAPGSKTTQLAQRMRNQGRIVALDSSAPRLSALKNNLERCGVKACLVYQKDAAHVDDLGLMFDRILLDAPCSGNFTTDPGWFEKRSPEGIRLMAKAQKSLLQAAVRCLRPAGTLVYSTCSLEPEEDEAVIEWALDALPAKLVETGLSVGEPGLTPKTRLCRRFWPEKTGTQGFFLAKIKLKG
ncbi:RsmB/NOP family class I SAM-dependent RNA methyltransferase [Candidatus Woesearchaeota archaeon]|nr:RsmB/NOP family class I SAM-dependent RNA methyltransferase [Candidatus Woesearchaeota archaeon]